MSLIFRFVTHFWLRMVIVINGKQAAQIVAQMVAQVMVEYM
jgi:hypothetical protein